MTKPEVDLIHCVTCGKDFDPRELDQVIFHSNNHRLAPATGIIGSQVGKRPEFGAPYGVKKPDA